MRRDEEVILLEELVGLKKEKQLFLDDAPTSNPVDDYTDATRFTTEMRQIFDRMPLIIAHASELDGPNSFLRRTVNQRPLLLLRGDDNEVRGFINVCRHRGTRLVNDESGCKRRHSCPYHAGREQGRSQLETRSNSRATWFHLAVARAWSAEH